MIAKYDIRRRRIYFLFTSIFSLVGLGVLTNLVLPYEIIAEPIVDNPTNYFLNQLFFSFIAIGFVAWIFVVAFLIGKSVGEDDV